MKLGEYLKYLQDKHFQNRCDALEFASCVTGIPYDKILLNLGSEVDTGRFEALLKRAECGEPLAYIINNKNFFGADFYVDSRVLIPRPETEILAEEALSIAGKMGGKVRILDICTGSGCILGTLLANLPDAWGAGVDISPDALEVADINLKNLGVSDRAELVCHDALDIASLGMGMFDIIVCNPPYLSDSEWLASDKPLKYEPKIALSAGADALLFYKKLLDTTPELCNKNGVVLFELGMEQSEAVMSFAVSEKCRIIKDYQHIERVLVWTNS
jgi:release factor glutamine methyltransferase